MSYQCEHDDQEVGDPIGCTWCLFNLEYALRLFGHNLVQAAYCAASERRGYEQGRVDELVRQSRRRVFGRGNAL